MNHSLIKALVLKDWYLNKHTAFFFTFAGLISIALLSFESKAAFYAGLVLLLSMVICIGGLLAYSTVINERKDKTLAFIMSLPVTCMDYTKAKMIFNLSVYLFSWLLLVSGTLGVIFLNDHLPNGLIPVAVIILIELMVAYLLVLGIALVTESEAWTTVTVAITNICVSLFMFLVGSRDGIHEHLEGDVAVWNFPALTIVAIELIVALLIIGITFYLQSRKKDFI